MKKDYLTTNISDWNKSLKHFFSIILILSSFFYANNFYAQDADSDGILDVDESCGSDIFINGDGGGIHTFNYANIIAANIDFDFIDNSLQVTVAGTTVHPNILDFEPVLVAPGDVLIEFLDNTPMVSPWSPNVNGLPRFRLFIAPSGNVQIFGTRNTTSVALEQMQTSDGSLFNSIVFPVGLTSINIENQNDTGLDAISGTVAVFCDKDGDGLADYLDLDSDNDSILDSVEGAGDTDFDGVPDFRDLDSDNDGIADVVESGNADIDNDGIVDGFTDGDGNGLNDTTENPELHTQDNAASTFTEVNSIGSWIPQNATIVSDATTFVDGSFSLKIQSTNTNAFERGEYNFPVINGTDYTIKIWAKQGIAVDGVQRFSNWVGFVTSPSVAVTSTTWTEYTINVTANITGMATIRAYSAAFVTSVADELFIDKISIRETLVQTPQDSDSDSIPDYLDLDSDNDGCFDSLEGAGGFALTDINGDGSLSGAVDANGVPGGALQATTPNVTDNSVFSPVCDADGDGVPYLEDLDDDNDGLTDVTEGLGDTDGDGVVDSLDLDSDNDGITDVIETGGIDADGNGVIDGFTDVDADGLNDTTENPELHTQDNAASTFTEVNSMGSWVAQNATVTSDGTTSIDGSFSLKIQSTNTNAFERGEFSFPVINGTDYTVKIWAKQGIAVDGAQRFTNWVGFVASPNVDVTTGIWTEYTFNVTANITGLATIRAYSAAFVTSVADELFIDKVSIRETLVQVLPNNDTDTFVDYLDLDSDNDGIPDNIEAQTTLGYIPPDGAFDANGVDTAYLVGLSPVNTDLAADNPDYLDLDSDDEGADDTTEATLTLLGTVGANGLDDNYDNGDNYVDVNGSFDDTQFDNFPDFDNDVNFAGGDVDFRDDFDNPDYDGDTVPDIGDLDDDNDGIIDLDESGGQDPSIDGDGDNIPFYLDDDDTNAVIGDDNGVIEPGFDFDNDGIPNHFDLDSDNDGSSDVFEALGADGDGDGILDGFVDADGDGLNDLVDNIDSGSGPGEVTTGTPLTDPNTDGDTLSDRLDLDSDNDGITDVTEAGGLDADGNGFIDGFTDVGPINGWDDATQITPLTDPNSDGDSLTNRLDLDSDNDGVTDATEAGGTDANGDGIIDGFTDAGPINGLDDATEITPLTDPNTDGDTLLDRLDLDSDNDGITDTIEAGGTDANGDGIIDGFDDTANGNGLDDTIEATPLADPNTDGDGVLDRLDLDSDNDGITDTTEAGGLDADGNGIIDGFTDVNGNGLDDATEATPLADPNSDGDSVSDRLDLDSDNDGITDTTEAGGLDVDGNGIIDGFTDADTNGLDDATEATPLADSDTDGDNVVDRLDLDSDNDGLTDTTETGGLDANSDGIIDGFTDGDTNGLDDATEATPLVDVDTDIDTVLDRFDLDNDNDGISNIIEAGGIDLDGDAQVDYVTPGDPTTLNDANNNGLDDSLETTPLPVPNTDGDSFADYIDIDADGDGIVDNIESQVSSLALGGYRAPSGSDDDNDGLDNNYDNNNLGNIVPVDTDGDLTPDYIDTNTDDDADDDILEGWDINNDGVISGGEFSPNGLDGDNDGLDNGFDFVGGWDVTNGGQNASIFPDLDTPGGEPDWREPLDIDWDNDGVDDIVDLDDDNDGIPDNVESGGNEPNGDADGDGIQNWLDVFDDAGLGDGSPTDYTDADGNGIPDVYDTDGDGVPNHFDLDSDNDGIYDLVESGQIDAANNVVDTNNDGIIDAANAGTVGANGLLDTIETVVDSGILTSLTADSDSDGIPDSNELNSDADGCNDVLEAGFTDGDNNGLLGNGTFGAGLTVDVNGVVNTAGLLDGYTLPNDNDTNGIFDFQEFGEAVSIAIQPSSTTVILNANANFDVTLGSGVNPTYEWFESTDGGVSFNSLVPDSGIYTGTDTAILTINANTLTLSGNRYYVEISAPGYACAGSIESDRVILTVVTDFDGDGIGDPTDLDDDNDGIPDSIEGTGDLDGDGNPNHQDLDADGDGVFDTNEAGFADLDANDDGVIDGVPADFGANGLFDGLEDNDTSTATITYTPLNTDGDANPDFLDIDDDGDGINTASENPSPDGNGDPADAQQTDTDSIPDYLDIDDDGDGILTRIEGSTNPDGDGRANYLDLDSDGDGIADNVEGQTTVGYIAPSGIDANGNGLDDAYEGTNGIQPVNSDAGVFGADATPDYLDLDSDGDNVPDNIEGHDLDHNGLPDNFPIGDADNDGLDDAYDSSNGYDDPNGSIITTDPATDLPDTDSTEDVDYRDFDDDGDGLDTRFEDLNGDGDFSNDDTDGNGVPNYLDNDDDGDGILTADEDLNGDGDPRNDDSDADGIPNYLDNDDDNDGIPTADEDVDGDGDVTNDDTDGDGRPNYLDIDDDGDGIMTITESANDEDADSHPNYLDLDSDDDGIPDNVEGQATASYDNPTGNDSDNDGLDDAYDNFDNDLNNVPGNYETTNGIQPVNTDGTDNDDYLDDDSDNDTVPDNIEGHDYDANGEADELPIGDSDNDGLDDAYDGSIGDFLDPNGLSVNNDPANDLPNRDGDVDGIYGGISQDAEVDYRDTDDDGDGTLTIDEDGNEDGDPTNDNCDEDAFPDYLDYTPCDLVPEGFSPDGDGVNDLLIIPALAQFPNFRMEVYDRWGNIVYEYDNNGRAQPVWWDGFSTGSRTINKGERVPVGTYFYVIEFNQERKAPISGWVYINY